MSNAFNPKMLSTAIDVALNIDDFNLFSADESLERLIAQTGKSRQEILQTVLTDDEVDACREDIEANISSHAYRIWGDALSEDDANRFYKIIKKHIKTLSSLAVLAKFNGYAIAEYIYKQDDTGFWYIDDILQKDGELASFSIKRDGRVLYHHLGDTLEVDTKVKCLALKSRATPSRPTGEMLVIKTYPAVLLRNKGFAYASQFIARYAQPYIIGKQGQMGGDVQAFAHTIFGLAGGGAAGIGSDESIDIHQLTSDGVAFELIERLCNRRIQKLLLGRVKISETDNGSRAATQTDDKARTDRMNGYLDLLAQAAQHAIDAMLLVNQRIGISIHAPNGVWFEYQKESDIDKIRAERDKLYLDAGQIHFTQDYFKDILGLEEHHFVMQNGAGASLDLLNKSSDTDNQDHALSDIQLSAQFDELDSAPTPSELSILSPKIDKIMALIDHAKDYTNLAQVLDNATLDSDEMVQDLADALDSEYAKGVDNANEG